MVCGEVAVVLKVLHGLLVADLIPVLAVLGGEARVIEPVDAADAVIEIARQIRLGELFIELLLRAVLTRDSGNVALEPSAIASSSAADSVILFSAA